MSRRDLAIDLGTSSTLIYEQDRGIVYHEPTLVAMGIRSGEVVAVGRAAWDAAGRSPATIAAVRPMLRGAITDFDLAQKMLHAILRRVGVGRLARPRALVCVPSLLTTVERRAVEEAVTAAGARSASLVEQPLAAAIGAGLPIHDPVGNMVVVVGGGTCEMAMVALGGLVTGTAIRMGGFDMDQAIKEHVRVAYDLAIGDTAAEQIKTELGSAYPAADARAVEVSGRELSSGMPGTIVLTPEEVREVLAEQVRTIVDTARTCLAESPPELAHDVLETGLFLSGGGALLRGLDMRIAQECEVPVNLTDRPVATVVTGAGRLLDYAPEQRAAFLAVARSIP